jgi:hypothetical protein
MMDNINPFIKGQVLSYCETVSLGIKTIALIPVLERFVDGICEYIEDKQQLYFYVEPLAEGWFNIYIFKYEFLKDVIKKLPEQPKTIYEHWILGKAFGYSDEAIAKFIENYALVNSVQLHRGHGGSLSESSSRKTV